MSLPLHRYRLAEVVESGLDMAGFAAGAGRTFSPPVAAVGECFAFGFQPLVQEAEREGCGWHVWLLRRAILGIWEEAPKSAAFVGYTLHAQMLRVFFCSRQRRQCKRFHAILSATPAFMESGQDSFPPHLARALALWEPPCTAVALWPRGLEGEADGARVVDTGNALAFFSYPEADHDAGLSVEEAGPEYVRVPQTEPGEFAFGGRVYRWLNRYDAGEREL